VDTGKLAGYSKNDDKIETIMESYTGEDNDEFMHELGEDFMTHGAKSGANPGGLELTKFNGERATRKFVGVAFKLDDDAVDGWMKKYFNQAWDRYDVNKSGAIQEGLLPTYFRSVLGDFKAQFSLRDDHDMHRVLRDPLHETD